MAMTMDEFGQQTIRIADAAPDGEVPIVVCLLASQSTPFMDNLHGVCAYCGVAVQHRPHVPQPNRLACMPCFLAVATAGDVNVMVTPATLVEVAAQLKADAERN